MSFATLLRRVRTNPSAGRKAKRPRSLVRWPRGLRLELLEGRVLPAVVSWVNSQGGSWNDPANWSTGTLPTAADDVTIDLAAVAAVHLSAGAVTVHSLTNRGTLVLDGGSLTVSGGATSFGTLSVESGAFTVQGGLAVSGGTFNYDGGSLSGTVTLTSAALHLGTGGTGPADFIAQGNSTLTGDLAAG
jgi:hypothetical protein